MSVKKGWLLFLSAYTTFETNGWVLSKAGMNIMRWEASNGNGIVKLFMPIGINKNIQQGLQQEVLSILTEKKKEISFLDRPEICVKCGIIQ